MVCKIIFCSEFPDIPDKAGRKARRRRRTPAIAKRYAFHANVITKENSDLFAHFILKDYNDMLIKSEFPQN